MSCGCDNEVPPVTAARCGNPCAVAAGNTAACELLPSQIANFTAAFFGSVVKSEVDGQVVWTLPCDLATGLENNPRGEDEGLACYFKRLFEEGIIGLTGPAGANGIDGAPGAGAYTETTAAFTEPDPDVSPVVTIFTANSPAIIAGVHVYVEGSGVYLVDVADGTGALILSAVDLDDEVASSIPVGAMVVPVGPPGLQGNPGPTGPTGPAWAPVASDLDYGLGTVNLDFSGAQFQTVALTGDLTLTTSGLAGARTKTLRIVADGSSRNLTFPGTWTFVGSAAPASIGANKVALLSLTSFGTTDANVVAVYHVSV